MLQAYTKQMAQCLLDMQSNSESRSILDLQRYSLELAAVAVCIWMSIGHQDALALGASMAKSLSPPQDSLGREMLPDHLYDDLLVLIHPLQIPIHTLPHIVSTARQHCQLMRSVKF